MAAWTDKLKTSFIQWCQTELVQEVPQEDALCEFDCRKLQCTQGEWETCDRRIRRAADELYPLPRVQPVKPACEHPSDNVDIDLQAAD